MKHSNTRTRQSCCFDQTCSWPGSQLPTAMLTTSTARPVESSAPCKGGFHQLRVQGTPAPASRYVRHPLLKLAETRVVCNATDTVDKPAPQDLAGEEQEQWQDGLHQLKDLGMDDALAEKCLKRGFGWSSQAYWWKDKVNDVPKPGEIKEKLDYLRGLGLDDDQLQEVVKLFPETVGLNLEKRMKPNVELMGKQFFIKGKMLPKTLARKPQALGSVQVPELPHRPVLLLQERCSSLENGVMSKATANWELQTALDKWNQSVEAAGVDEKFFSSLQTIKFRIAESMVAQLRA